MDGTSKYMSCTMSTIVSSVEVVDIVDAAFA